MADEESTRSCRRCGEAKPLTEFWDHPKKTKHTCKACDRIRTRALTRRWRAAHIDTVRARDRIKRRAYVEKHRDEINAKQRAEYTWRSAPARERARARVRQTADVNAYHRRLRISNPEHYARHKELNRRWAAAHRDLVAQYTRKHRMLRNGAAGFFTLAEFRSLCARYGNRCLACGATDRNLTADHVVPLTRGGSNHLANIQPLCQSCNSRKNVQTIDYRPTP